MHWNTWAPRRCRNDTIGCNCDRPFRKFDRRAIRCYEHGRDRTLLADGKSHGWHHDRSGACGSRCHTTAVNNRAGVKKDTVRNIEVTSEFVVNIVPYALAEPMNATSAGLPHGESEFAHFGIASAASVAVRPPRVAAAPVAFECRLDRIVLVGEGASGANVVFGTILRAHIADTVLGTDGRLDPQKLDTIGRMGGDFYARTTELFVVHRPPDGSALRAT